MGNDHLRNFLQLKMKDDEDGKIQQEYIAMRDFIKQFEFVRQTASGEGNGTYVGAFHINKYIENMEIAYQNYLEESAIN